MGDIPVSTPTTMSWKDQLTTLASSIDTKAEVKKYNLDKIQFFVVLGIAISGLAAFINTYNAISGINENMINCAQTDELNSELTLQFIIMLTISIIIIIVGVIFMILFRDDSGLLKIIALSTVTIGIFGIIYAISIQLQKFTNAFKIGFSWLIFIIFIILAIVFRNKHIKAAPK